MKIDCKRCGGSHEPKNGRCWYCDGPLEVPYVHPQYAQPSAAQHFGTATVPPWLYSTSTVWIPPR